MRYALLIHYPQPAASTLTQDEIKAGMAAFQAYAKALDEFALLTPPYDPQESLGRIWGVSTQTATAKVAVTFSI